MHANVKTKRPKPLILLILDGLGVADPNPGNAVTLADTPNLSSYWQKFPHTYLEASGNFVGLPTGTQGNSEVGHMSLGSGRVMFQEIARIDHAIEEGSFFDNETFKQALAHAKKTDGNLHLIGLLSDGNVHASINHLFACLEFCKRQKFPGDKVFIHAFTDGRDTAPNVAGDYLRKLEKYCKQTKVGQIASVIGRYYAMDRDERWDRTQEAYDLITQGKGEKVENWKQAVDSSYKNDITDEYIKAHVIIKNGEPVATINSGDAIIYWNYRADRAVQLSKAFEHDKFDHFELKSLKDIYFAGFSNYEKGMVMNRATEDWDMPGGERGMVEKLFPEELEKSEQGFPEHQLFPPQKVEKSLGELLEHSNLTQLRLAESEKFPHVTYFFSGRRKTPFEHEERVEIPSPRDVATYDLKPEMSTYEIMDRLLKDIDKGKFDFCLVNFALTDMVAHTGNLEASKTAVEVADKCVGELVKHVLSAGGEIIITADHGNIEELVNLQTGDKDTKHSINPVPVTYITNKSFSKKEFSMGMLADIAPTILSILGLGEIEQMTGRNLFE